MLYPLGSSIRWKFFNPLVAFSSVGNCFLDLLAAARSRWDDSMRMILKLYLGFTIFWTAISPAQSPQAGAAVSDQLRLQWQFDTKG